LVRGEDLVGEQGRHSPSFISDSTVTSVAKVTDLRSGVRPVVDAPQAAAVDVAVDLRGRERAVPEQLLDHPEVGTPLEQVGGEGMPEAVRVGRQAAEGAGVEAAAAGGEEDRVLRACGAAPLWPRSADFAGAACSLERELRASLAEVVREPVRRLLAERHRPFFPTLAANVDELLVEVDVLEIEPDRLGAAQAGGVDELDEGTVAQAERPVALDAVEQRVDLAGLRRDRKAARPLRRE